MPLQNRVLPTGEIVADPHRGLLMGNRGCLHGMGRTLGTTRWRSKLWICCVLKWRDWRRDPMPPGRWTALFFLDEATALSAGHRPCAYCRRADYVEYGQAWARAAGLAQPLMAGDLDAALHAERVTRTRQQVLRPARAAGLPDGAMVRVDGAPGLLLGGRFRTWTPQGYGDPVRPPTTVQLMTPPSSVAAIEAGYRPWLHPSAGPGAGWRTL